MTPPELIDLAAESQLLGGLLAEGGGPTIDYCYANELRAGAFYDATHQAIYTAMLDVYYRDGHALNKISLDAALRTQGTHASLAPVYVYPADMQSYCDIVKDLHMKRRLYDAAGAVRNEVVATDKSAFDVMTRHTNELSKLVRPDEKDADPVELMDESIAEIELANTTGTIPGILTGIDQADKAMAGLQKGGYYIIKGDPGHGKTTLARSVCVDMALRGISVAYYTAEQTQKMILAGMMGQVAQFNMYRGRIGKAVPREGQLEKARDDISKLKLIVRDKPMTPSAFKAMVKRDVEMSGVQVVFLDYLQALAFDEGCVGLMEHSEMCTRAVKESSKQHEISIVALSSTSNDGSLRFSKQIEFDAFTVVSVGRAETWSHSRMLHDLMIEKNRFGPNMVEWQMVLQEDGSFDEVGREVPAGAGDKLLPASGEIMDRKWGL